MRWINEFHQPEFVRQRGGRRISQHTFVLHDDDRQLVMR
jgi:hypothetical protein